MACAGSEIARLTRPSTFIVCIVPSASNCSSHVSSMAVWIASRMAWAACATTTGWPLPTDIPIGSSMISPSIAICSMSEFPAVGPAFFNLNLFFTAGPLLGDDGAVSAGVVICGCIPES